MNIALRHFLHNHGNIATEGRVHYSAQYHRQHCTLQAFGQSGALWMHNFECSTRPGFRAHYLWVSSHNQIEWAIGTGVKYSFVKNIMVTKRAKLLCEAQMCVMWSIHIFHIPPCSEYILSETLYNIEYHSLSYELGHVWPLLPVLWLICLLQPIRNTFGPHASRNSVGGIFESI